MNATVGWPALAMPKGSVVGAALATIMLATTLVVAPVPLINDVSQVSADPQRECFNETVTVPVYSSNPAYADGPIRDEQQIRTRCVDIDHSHPEEVAAKLFVVITSCGIAGLYGPWFGVACAVGFGALELSEAIND